MTIESFIGWSPFYQKNNKRSWMIFNKKVLVCEGTASRSLQSSSMAGWYYLQPVEQVISVDPPE
jgi:hypothetical protein